MHYKRRGCVKIELNMSYDFGWKSWKSEDRSTKTEDRSPKSEVGSPK